MALKAIKCPRCKEKGNVRKYIMTGCSEYFLEIWDMLVSTTLYFPLYLLASFIIGGIFGFFYSILLKNTLSFNFFGIIFYFSGGMSISFIALIFFSEYKILFKNNKNTSLVLIILFLFGYFNLKFGRYLILSKGLFKMILNLCYSFIQGGCIFFTLAYLLFKKSLLDENNGRTKCPLCDGSKFILLKHFSEMKRCHKCNMNSGYNNPIGIALFQKREFCNNCNGVGYIK